MSKNDFQLFAIILTSLYLHTHHFNKITTFSLSREGKALKNQTWINSVGERNTYIHTHTDTYAYVCMSSWSGFDCFPLASDRQISEVRTSVLVCGPCHPLKGSSQVKGRKGEMKSCVSYIKTDNNNTLSTCRGNCNVMNIFKCFNEVNLS